MALPSTFVASASTAFAAGWTAVGVVVLVLFVLNWWWVLRQHGFLLGQE